MIDIILSILLLMIIYIIWNMQQLFLRYFILTAKLARPITISLKVILEYCLERLRRFFHFITRLLTRNNSIFRGIQRNHIERLQNQLQLIVIEA
ncbi:MAG: hypothetical protein ACRCWI_00550 [Brevinema sp.]